MTPTCIYYREGESLGRGFILNRIVLGSFASQFLQDLRSLQIATI